MNELLRNHFREAGQVLQDTLDASAGSMARAADLLVAACHARQGIFLFGNGGSAADAQHVAGELNGRWLVTVPA